MFLSAQLSWADCAPDRAHIKVGSSIAAFDVEVADTFKTRAQGLMFRQSLPKFAGMLFIYRYPQDVSFWMQNTLIPLDIIFMDRSGTVIKIHSNAVPMDTTQIYGGDSVLAVLEINGGLAEKLRIKPGAILQHPAFDQEIAAWPCKN